MVVLYPETHSKNGKKFIVIPYEEFEAWQEEIEEIRDAIAFAESESGSAPRVPWEKLKAELGL